MTTPRSAADDLNTARRTRTPRAPFTDTDPTLTEDWGYEVQNLDRAQRLASGEHIVGAKLGLTSRAKQRTMGVGKPVVGFLTDAMQLDPSHDTGMLAGTRQPRIEPEIAFQLAHDLDRPLTRSTVTQAIAAVAAAAEIIDSRYGGFRFRLPDVIADNTSAAAFLLGPWVTLDAAGDLTTAGCTLSVDGREIHAATGAAILGHPLHALIHLSEHLTRQGQRLPTGTVVLAGALTDAIPLQSGAIYRTEIRSLGTVEFTAP